MSGWKRARVYGTDLSGRRCVVAEVSVPDQFTRAAALAYIRGLSRTDPVRGIEYRPYAAIADADLDVRDGSIEVQPCPHCGRKG